MLRAVPWQRIALLGIVGAMAAGAADLPPQEFRGRTLYRKGLGASGKPVSAFLAGETEVNGDMVPCAGCHGLDGRGRAEGGVTPSSVRWQDLVRPYEVIAPTGRKHSQYNERSLVSAIALGLDPAGNKLHPVMPRYALTRSDADDLIAYLKVLASDSDPGVADVTIRIGALLPSEKRFPGMAPIVRSSLAAVFDDLNRAGGIYGRRVELVVGEMPEQEVEAGAAYSRFIESQNVFALVSSFLAGVEEQALEFVKSQKIPLVGGWTLLPGTSSTVFFLDGGLPAQAEALSAFGAERYSSDAAPVILSTSDRLSRAALESARTRWPGAKQLPLESVVDASRLIARLKSEKTGVVLALLPAVELRALLIEAKRSDWNPAYLIPSSFIPPALMPDLVSLTSPVFAASTFLAGDVTPEGEAEYKRLAAAAKLPPNGFASQFTSMAEARILIEGLKRAGRDLSRERLVQSLEAIYDFPAGYRQSVSFGPNRRVGIPQVHIVAIEKTGAFREVTRP